ncbi:MAG: isoprenylcysteine carboxylmethyltransferase family protein [Rhodospirillales bacterium]|nr:isoprenylcysteine carboxylmethyltransferase family protein [Rhodospirillales bacterium]
MASLLLLIGFNTGLVVPWSLGMTSEAFSLNALLINLGLIALFGVQHSVMARQGFKTALTKIIPAAAERSTYCLATAVLIGVIVMYWQPLPGALWQMEAGNAAYAVTAVSLAGWGLVALSSFLIDHFDLFGLRQVWLHWRKAPYTPVPMKSPALYKWVRHPLYVGILIGIWSTPSMTWGHLMFSAGITVYILIGIAFEEKDLVQALGDDYRRYQTETPALIPRPPAKKS